MTLLLIILKFLFENLFLVNFCFEENNGKTSVKRKMGIDIPRLDTADIGRLLLRLRDEIEGAKSALNSGSGM